jgi:hypothetical protein
MDTDDLSKTGSVKAGSLEAKIFYTPSGRLGSPPWMQNSEKFIAVIQTGFGFAFPFAYLLLIMGLDNILFVKFMSTIPGNGYSIPTGLTLLPEHLLLLMVSWLLVTVNCLLVRARVQRTREALATSDLVVRILSGWTPEYQENQYYALLRRLEPRRKEHRSIQDQFILSSSQLAYFLGLSRRPAAPAFHSWGLFILLALVPQATFTIILVTSMNATYDLRYAQYALTAVAMLGMILVNLVGHSLFATAAESLLLREHLREIDNGVLTMDVSEAVEIGDA